MTSSVLKFDDLSWLKFNPNQNLIRKVFIEPGSYFTRKIFEIEEFAEDNLRVRHIFIPEPNKTIEIKLKLPSPKAKKPPKYPSKFNKR
ncbi:MAG: hypothetical protein EBS55_12490 [Flavobacteriaceae bacterium]|nr:hypothetical protein [Flavobacteriaceae bacterium]